MLAAESLIASSASARCPEGIANALASGIVDCLIKEPPTQTPAKVSTITFGPVATRLMALFSSINNAVVCGDSGYQEGSTRKPGTVISFLNMSPAVLAPQDKELAQRLQRFLQYARNSNTQLALALNNPSSCPYTNYCGIVATFKNGFKDWFIHPTPEAFRFPLGAPIAWRDDDLTQKLKEWTDSTNPNEADIPKRERQFNERIAAVVAQVCFPGVEKVFLAGHKSFADDLGYDLVVKIRGPNGKLELYGYDIKSSVFGVNRRLTDFIKHRQRLKQNVQELTGWVGVFHDDWKEYILKAIRENNICEFIQEEEDDDDDLMKQVWSICNLLPNDFATTEQGLRLGLPLPVDLDNLENIIKYMETAFALEPHPDAFYCVQALAIGLRSGFERESREYIFDLFESLRLCKDMSHKLFNAMLEFEVFVET